MESTTDILRERARDQGSLGQSQALWRAYALSLVSHAVLIAVIIFWPAGFLSSSETEVPTVVMNISLGGPVGPSQGGLTALAARPVQEALPLEEADEAQWEQPPAPAPPEMPIPTPDARRRPEADVAVESAPDESRGRTPTRGPTLRREGNALAETGSEGDGAGLSAGGLGSGVQLDVADFCCPEYLSLMVDLIDRRWNRRQRVSAEVKMKFTIQRDGQLTDIELETPSGYFALDTSAERALRLASLTPLPSRFASDDLTVHLTFRYFAEERP